MKILILGSDGYIGHPLSNHLRKKGHQVIGYDNYSRRHRAKHSLTPTRKREAEYGYIILFELYEKYDAIVHLAEQPSAPWSMKDKQSAFATQYENINGTLSLLWEMKKKNPDAHLVKIGTLGEYGYSHGVPIPEGFIDDGPMKGMRFPPNANSFYHLSKVFDSLNIEFACKTWGLRSTDIMQGIVFGLNYWEDKLTRFDYDEYFGTVVNRFCAQAISGYPLTVYGQGGQTRGYLPLSDSIECLTLAIENPPDPGEYRVFNQFADTFSVNEIAGIIREITGCEINHIDNPRTEVENHPLTASNEGLRKLGYDPKWDFKAEIKKLLDAITPYADRVNKAVIKPTHSWR